MGQTPESARLLVIDDEPMVLKLVKTILSRAHYEVTTCTSALEALNILNNDEGFDCIITDAIMPQMNGFELVKAIRQHPECTHLPILMLTRKRDRQDVKKAVEAGASDYVLKPVDEHLLLDKVELCLKKSPRRHILSLSLIGSPSQAVFNLSCKIISLSESELIVQIPCLLSQETPFTLRTELFDEIGITSPLMKVKNCELAGKALEGNSIQYEAKLTLMGVSEADLMKIRSWIQREMIRRHKHIPASLGHH